LRPLAAAHRIQQLHEFTGRVAWQQGLAEQSGGARQQVQAFFHAGAQASTVKRPAFTAGLNR